ncbi:MAG: Fic family protein [bacterium]|nr:Fic family protein [bacterium]
MDISKREQKVIYILLEHRSLQSSEIHKMLLERKEDVSLVTVKRALASMTAQGILTASGAGRSSSYTISALGRLYADIDAQAYCAIEPDRRYGQRRYDQNLFAAIPATILSEEELRKLKHATAEYIRRTTNLPPAIEKRELERMVIELSWKSSKIEGNTYTLLDTEKLILENKEAPGHTRDEARMILNHKDAFNFVLEHAASFKSLSRAYIEKLHAIIIKDLNVGTGLRKRVVGITGSIYQPLDNQHQIREGLEELIAAALRLKTPYEKALIALLGISYLQPFEDGNKRTARLLANAILLAHACSPLSYRSVEEGEYRAATLVFYELHSIVPFKAIFIEQYVFAAGNYAVKSGR